LLLCLWHKLCWNRTHLDVWTLLTYQTINNIKNLVPQTRLTQCPRASRDSKRPQEREANDANGTNGCFIQPFLLSNHGKRATTGMLKGH
jgi:hypothetical protein